MIRMFGRIDRETATLVIFMNGKMQCYRCI